MREDHQDQIDKIFPDGYLIIYTCPDGQVRYNKYNPKRVFTLAFYERLINQQAEKLGSHYSDWHGERGNAEGMNKDDFEDWMDNQFQDYKDKNKEEEGG